MLTISEVKNYFATQVSLEAANNERDKTDRRAALKHLERSSKQRDGETEEEHKQRIENSLVAIDNSVFASDVEVSMEAPARIVKDRRRTADTLLAIDSIFTMAEATALSMLEDEPETKEGETEEEYARRVSERLTVEEFKTLSRKAKKAALTLVKMAVRHEATQKSLSLKPQNVRRFKCPPHLFEEYFRNETLPPKPTDEKSEDFADWQRKKEAFARSGREHLNSVLQWQKIVNFPFFAKIMHEPKFINSTCIREENEIIDRFTDLIFFVKNYKPQTGQRLKRVRLFQIGAAFVLDEFRDAFNVKDPEEENLVRRENAKREKRESNEQNSFENQINKLAKTISTLSSENADRALLACAAFEMICSNLELDLTQVAKELSIRDVSILSEDSAISVSENDAISEKSTSETDKNFEFSSEKAQKNEAFYRKISSDTETLPEKEFSTGKEAAFYLAKKHGFRVFPTTHKTETGGDSCKKGDKCPAIAKHSQIAGWQKKASNNKAEIEKLFAPYPNAGVGILCDVFVTLDFDPRNGGLETLRKVFSEIHIPETYTQKTGGNGLHLVFKTTPERAKQISSQSTAFGPGYEGLDIKSHGKNPSLIIGAGSTHSNGNKYEILVDAPTAELTDELFNEIMKRRVKQSTQTRPRKLYEQKLKYQGFFIPNGQRNDYLKKLYYAKRYAGKSAKEAHEIILQAYEQRCDKSEPIDIDAFAASCDRSFQR